MVLPPSILSQEAVAAQRVLADAMPTLVMMSDRDGIVTFFNRCWYEFTGQPPFERDVDWDWRKYLHADDAARVAMEWQSAVLAGQDIVEMEYRLREAATGDYRWFHARAAAIRDASGDIVQWVGTAMDIDEAFQTRTALADLYERERSVARTFQKASLPTSLPDFPGAQLDGFYRPSAQDLIIGGDWYDAFELSDHSLVLSVGDVVGHGIDAAVIMGKIRHTVRTLFLHARSDNPIELSTLLKSVEDALESEHPGETATMFLGVVAPDGRHLRYANAGHPPPLLRQTSAKATWLEAYGMPLGWSFGSLRTQNNADLRDTTELVLYTDGLVEAGRDIERGMERLKTLVEAGDVFSADSPAKAIADAPGFAHAHDDVAVLTVRFLAPRGQEPRG